MKQRSYIDSVHLAGKIWGLSILVLMLLFPFLLSVSFHATPIVDGMIKGMLAVVPLYNIVGTIEIFTYTPMLGAGGTYLGFITGNLSNLKVPCVLDSLERSGYDANSEEGECISTIAVATSSIVTMLIIILGIVLISPLSALMEKSEVLTIACNQLLPALFGALAVVYCIKNLKIAIFPVCLMILLFVFIPALNASMVGIMVPVSVVLTLIYARIMYKAGKL